MKKISYNHAGAAHCSVLRKSVSSKYKKTSQKHDNHKTADGQASGLPLLLIHHIYVGVRHRKHDTPQLSERFDCNNTQQTFGGHGMPCPYIPTRGRITNLTQLSKPPNGGCISPLMYV